MARLRRPRWRPRWALYACIPPGLPHADQLRRRAQLVLPLGPAHGCWSWRCMTRLQDPKGPRRQRQGPSRGRFVHPYRRVVERASIHINRSPPLPGFPSSGLPTSSATPHPSTLQTAYPVSTIKASSCPLGHAAHIPSGPHGRRPFRPSRQLMGPPTTRDADPIACAADMPGRRSGGQALEYDMAAGPVLQVGQERALPLKPLHPASRSRYSTASAGCVACL